MKNAGDTELVDGVNMASNTLLSTARMRGFGVALVAGLSLAACASAGAPTPSAGGYGYSRGGDAIDGPTAPFQKASGGAYKLGAPYQAGGLWYVPAEDPGYDVTGVAGVYGDGVANKTTANGEAVDISIPAAAHATLPMPSIVEVTNLDNGRTLRVRLNDRGANKAGRVIDLNQAAAQSLGVAPRGTAKVRVRYVGPARLDNALEPLFIAQPVAPAAPAVQPAILSRPAPSITAAAQSPSSGDYLVQAGAFSERSRADQVASAITGAGKVAIRPVEVAGRQLYRVVVGGWDSAGDADQARLQVAALGYPEARVVRAQ